MAAAEKSREQAFIREVLKLYQSLPAIWNTSCKDYNDRLKKKYSYNCLLAKYRQRYPAAVKEDLTKKINTLRSNYRKIKKAHTEESVRQSKCWYYNDIQFLEDKDPDQVSIPLDDSHQSSFISLVKYDQSQEQPKPAVVKESGTLPACQSVTDSEYMTIARVWANELAKAAPEQQMYAKKAINDILFEAQMGTLSRHSVMINDSPEIVNYYTQKEPE